MTTEYIVTDETIDLLTGSFGSVGNSNNYGSVVLADGTIVHISTARIDGSYSISALIRPAGGTWADSLTELVAKSSTSSPPMSVEATALSGGGFFVTWNSYDSATGLYSLTGQAFNADGSAAADPVVIGASSNNIWNNADLEELSDGRLVAAWHASTNDNAGINQHDGRYGAYGRILEADGTPAGDSFEIDAFNDDVGTEAIGYNDRIFDPDLVALEDGTFLATWWEIDRSPTQGYFSSDDNIHAQLFAADGSQVGGDIEIMDGRDIMLNSDTGITDTDIRDPAAASQADGGTLIVARQAFNYYARFRAADGTLSDYMLLDDFYDSDTRNTDMLDDITVAALGDGRYLAAWTRYVTDDQERVVNSLIQGQYFSSDGTREGSIVTLAEGGYTYDGGTSSYTYWYSDPEIEALPGGGFVLDLFAPIANVDPVYVFDVDDTIITGTPEADVLQGGWKSETYY
uniref:hypothetical protein n=1 Tax=Poseidonocella sp. HB161398 TaxID=2320855 RepID=UPI001108DC2E